MPNETTRDVGIILSDENFEFSFMEGETPSLNGDSAPPTDVVDVGLIKPPVDPRVAVSAVRKNGDLAAVCHAVGNGCAGVTYVAVPRITMAQGGPNLDDPKSWSPEIRLQHDILQVLIQSGFHGKGAQTLRSGFYEQEHDRVMLGWGGVMVYREPSRVGPAGIPMPRAFGRFEAVHAKFTKPDRNPTWTPVPVVTIDGRILWTEELRHFRRLVMEKPSKGMFSTGSSRLYFKEFGDWRSMDAKTGRRSTGSRRLPPKNMFEPGTYNPGNLGPKSTPAAEVMTWATSFPGAAPYGISAWHSELNSVEVSTEASQLLLTYLKSGLHSVILAAADRPFEDASANAAISKIDELGRGRKGLGALITIALAATSDAGNMGLSPAAMFGQATNNDRGKLILHEINTKLPQEVLDGKLRSTMASSLAQAERLPELLVGKSQAYNFATAGSAWRTVNRLRFSPHHEERVLFLNRIAVEMGITHWMLDIVSPEWEEPPGLTGVATIAGQTAGLSPNTAVKLMSEVSDAAIPPFDEWWGEIPFLILNMALTSNDPSALLTILGYEEQAKALHDLLEKSANSGTEKPVAKVASNLVSDILNRLDDIDPEDIPGAIELLQSMAGKEA